MVAAAGERALCADARKLARECAAVDTEVIRKRLTVQRDGERAAALPGGLADEVRGELLSRRFFGDMADLLAERQVLVREDTSILRISIL